MKINKSVILENNEIFDAISRYLQDKGICKIGEVCDYEVIVPVNIQGNLEKSKQRIIVTLSQEIVE